MSSRDHLERLSELQLHVSENSGTPKSPILIGFSIINHPFGVPLICGNTQLGNQKVTLNHLVDDTRLYLSSLERPISAGWEFPQKVGRKVREYGTP